MSRVEPKYCLTCTKYSDSVILHFHITLYLTKFCVFWRLFFQWRHCDAYHKEFKLISVQSWTYLAYVWSGDDKYLATAPVDKTVSSNWDLEPSICTPFPHPQAFPQPLTPPNNIPVLNRERVGVFYWLWVLISLLFSFTVGYYVGW